MWVRVQGPLNRSPSGTRRNWAWGLRGGERRGSADRRSGPHLIRAYPAESACTQSGRTDDSKERVMSKLTPDRGLCKLWCKAPQHPFVMLGMGAGRSPPPLSQGQVALPNTSTRLIVGRDQATPSFEKTSPWPSIKNHPFDSQFLAPKSQPSSTQGAMRQKPTTSSLFETRWRAKSPNLMAPTTSCDSAC